MIAAQRAVDLDAARFEAYLVMSMAQMQLGEYAAAKLSGKKALELAPEDRRKVMAPMLDVEREQRFQARMADAKAARELNRVARAAESLVAAFSERPERADVGLQAAALLTQVEEHGRALEVLGKLPASEDAKKLRASIEAVVRPAMESFLAKCREGISSGNLAAARKACDEALALMPTSPDAEFEMARVLARASDPAGAKMAMMSAMTHGFRRSPDIEADQSLCKLCEDGEVADLVRDVFGVKVVARIKAAADSATPGAGVLTGIGLSMLRVGQQSFQMGSPVGEDGRSSDESLHEVKITKGYWLAETEVTQKQWISVMNTRPWRGQSFVIEGDEVAASYVSWNEAVEFCRKLTEVERSAGRLPTGYVYALPSEAEWELACRAGTKTRYSFGDGDGQLGKFAVFEGAKSGQYAHAVKSRQANGWGFYDMHGNVWEWCADEVDYSSGVVSAVYREGAVDPLNRGGPQRAYRGGGWFSSAAGCRSALRDALEPGLADFNLGFRPALVARSDK